MKSFLVNPQKKTTNLDRRTDCDNSHQLSMRLAVFRSHSLGKSTFMRNPFAASTRKVMTSNFARNLTDCTMAFSFFYNISRVKIYNQTSDNVIFDRPPIDSLAYSQYIANHGTTDIDDHFVEMMVAAVRDSLKNIDLLVLFQSATHGPSPWKTTTSAPWICITATKLMRSTNRPIATIV